MDQWVNQDGRVKQPHETDTADKGSMDESIVLVAVLDDIHAADIADNGQVVQVVQVGLQGVELVGGVPDAECDVY